VSDGILFNSDGSLFVSVIMVSSPNSVDTSSLNLSVLLQSVVRGGSDFGVGGPVGLPGGGDGGDRGLVSGNSTFDFSDLLLVLFDFTLDGLDFLFDGFLLFLFDLFEALLDRLKSRLQVLLLGLVGGELGFLLVDLPRPDGELFLVLGLLVLEFGLLCLEFLFFLFVVVLLLDDVGGLDTFSDVGDSLLLCDLGLFFGILDLGGHLGDHGSRVSNLTRLLNLLLRLSLNNLLGLGDLRGDAGQFLLQGFDVGGLR